MRFKRSSIMCEWTRPFWGTDCWRSPNILSLAQQPLFEVPALRELESACRDSILCNGVTVPTVCFSGVVRVRQRGSAAVCNPNPPRPFARYREVFRRHLQNIGERNCADFRPSISRKTAAKNFKIYSINSTCYDTAFFDRETLGVGGGGRTDYASNWSQASFRII